MIINNPASLTGVRFDTLGTEKTNILSLTVINWVHEHSVA